MNNRVLVIDSGVGGLTTLACIRRTLPLLDLIYYADDTFLPYGNKTEGELICRLCEIVSGFENKICAVVLACNTATGVAVDFLRKVFCFPIVGTEPAVGLACKTEGLTAVLVTELEAKQKKFIKLIEGKNVLVFPQKELATAIENALIENKTIVCLENILTDYISFLKAQIGSFNIKKIVLGCTHYVFLKYIKSFNEFVVFDGNEGVARRLGALVLDVGEGTTEIVFASKNKKKSQIALGLLNELLLFDF